MIEFWRTSGLYGPFSNFARFGFALDGAWWATSEHYYQAQKTTDPLLKEHIRLASTPKEAKNLASSVPLREDWESIKYNVMKKALVAKFTQNPKLQSLLISTGSDDIGEASPYDAIWGLGKDGKGTNLLGKCLMEIRSEFIKNNPLSEVDKGEKTDKNQLNL